MKSKKHIVSWLFLVIMTLPILSLAQVDSNDFVQEEIPSEHVESKEVSLTENSEGITDPINILESFSFSNIFWSIVILILTYFILKLLALILTRIAEKSTTYRISIKGFIPIINILGWSLAIYMIIAGLFKPSMSALVAAGASIGLAVGFASQDILKNIFAGIVIIFDRPFVLGDKIDIANHYGEVIDIGLRSTRIVTPDDSIVAVPNAEIMTSTVSNANSGEANCQVVAEIYLPLDIDTERTRKIATEAAQISKYVYLNKPVVILFLNEIKEHRIYLKMRVKAYVSDIRNEFKFKSDMTEIVIRELIKEGIIKDQHL